MINQPAPVTATRIQRRRGLSCEPRSSPRRQLFQLACGLLPSRIETYFVPSSASSGISSDPLPNADGSRPSVRPGRNLPFADGAALTSSNASNVSPMPTGKGVPRPACPWVERADTGSIKPQQLAKPAFDFVDRRRPLCAVRESGSQSKVEEGRWICDPTRLTARQHVGDFSGLRLPIDRCVTSALGDVCDN
jgi:hypothetical protein